MIEFKKTDKKVYAWLEFAGNKEYYLASAADSICGLSTGVLFVNGFLSEPVFLKNTLGKLGIEADFVAHGKYKNAPDIFTREEISEPHREVINSILDDFYERLLKNLSESRGLEISAVRELIDEGFHTIADGYRHGLIDSLMYFHQFKTHLAGGGDEKLRTISLSGYKEAPVNAFRGSARHKIAVIYGVGTIVTGSERQYGENLITSEGMASSIRRAAQDDDISAIILRVDSPGGSGMASDVIWREVVVARDSKPVIVSVSDVAASGGYYISMAADSIIASPSSIVGSIGVFAGKFSLGGLYEKIGLQTDMITRGRNADLFSETQRFTPEQRRKLHDYIMEFYEEFVTRVATGRGMTIEEVDAIAQGRVWTGAQALEIGLVDRLGDFDDAISMAKRMIGIPEDELVQVLFYPQLRSFIERLFEHAEQFEALKFIPFFESLSPQMQQAIHALPHFREGEPLYLMPYDLNIR